MTLALCRGRKSVECNQSCEAGDASRMKTHKPRLLRHPGTFNPIRIKAESSTYGIHIRLSLKPGESLFDAIVKPLAELNIHDASTTILCGAFEQLYYCVAPPDPEKHAVIAYSKPRDAGRAYMIFGNATLGRSIKGEPLVHCHAVIRTASGDVMGGHIITEQSIVGSKPISVLVTSIVGIELRQAFDEETRVSLLQPYGGEPHG